MPVPEKQEDACPPKQSKTPSDMLEVCPPKIETHLAWLIASNRFLSFSSFYRFHRFIVFIVFWKSVPENSPRRTRTLGTLCYMFLSPFISILPWNRCAASFCKLDVCPQVSTGNEVCPNWIGSLSPNLFWKSVPQILS